MTCHVRFAKLTLEFFESIYNDAPTESGPGVRCPATPTFVRDARRLYPAATVGRTHRRSASMDPVQLGLAAGSRVRSSTAAAPTGHRRNVSMDPATGELEFLRFASKRDRMTDVMILLQPCLRAVRQEGLLQDPQAGSHRKCPSRVLWVAGSPVSCCKGICRMGHLS